MICQDQSFTKCFWVPVGLKTKNLVWTVYQFFSFLLRKTNWINKLILSCPSWTKFMLCFIAFCLLCTIQPLINSILLQERTGTLNIFLKCQGLMWRCWHNCLPMFLEDPAETQLRTSLPGASRKGGLTCWPESVQYLLRTYATTATMREALEDLRITRQNKNDVEKD